MADENMIIVKQGPFELRVPRSELVEVLETADGVVFQFKGGLSLQKMDQYMPITMKQLMKNTSDSFPQAHLEFDLLNANKPVRAILGDA